MSRQEKAITYFKNGFNCSQSVLTSFTDETGLTENDSLKVACTFGAGMGRQQLTCGAVTGAMMVIGMKLGKGLNDEDSKKKASYEKVVVLFDEFKKLHGSTTCRDLVNNLDMNKEEDHQRMISEKIFETKCRKYIEDAVTITEKIILP